MHGPKLIVLLIKHMINSGDYLRLYYSQFKFMFHETVQSNYTVKSKRNSNNNGDQFIFFRHMDNCHLQWEDILINGVIVYLIRMLGKFCEKNAELKAGRSHNLHIIF